MMSSKRDLLVLSKRATNDPIFLKREVELLDSILLLIETTHNLCSCVEVIDINKYKILQKSTAIEKVVKQTALKPFEFIFNKN